MQFIGFLLCIFKDFYCANLNTRVGRIDRPSTVHSAALHERSGTTFDKLRDHPSMNSGTGLANCELQIANCESLRVLRVLCGKKTALRLLRTQGPPSMNSGTALANCELQIANSESLRVLRVLRGKKTNLEPYLYPMQQPTLAIIGLGYVGLPLAVAFSKLYKTIGFDIDQNRVSDLQAGRDKTRQISPEALQTAFQQTTPLQLTASPAAIQEADIYIVTVPTPVYAHKKPDLRALLAASKQVGACLQKGNLVIYESTVYPGCTEEDCVPVLEAASGLSFNQDFYVGYSPERINPGDTVNTLTKIKKVTSGSTPAIGQQVDQLYKSIITAGTHLAPSIRVAEAAKAIENAQRDVNISFVNELALIFDRMGVDTTEVLAAAATKWNFLPFKPGLVGGHCIGVDPYYLAYKAEKLGYIP
jgi:hypothetical protein